MLSQLIRSIGQEINGFKNKSRAIKPSPQAVDILKDLMESVEVSISDFKEKQRLKFDELTNDEKILLKEMENYEKKIQSWATVTNENEHREAEAAKGGFVSDKNAKNCELLKEVVDFDVSGPFFFQSLNCADDAILSKILF